MNYQRRFDYEITTAELLQKLRNLNDKKSYLKSDKKVIIMCGFFEDSHLCYHLQLTNMHSTPVIFNVESPRGRAFGATPHVGVIMPQCKTTIYCTFRSERVSRIPDDGIYIYSIFQKAISADKFINAQNDKEKERIARKIWSQHRGKCFECLRLPVGFEPRRPAAHEQHIELCTDIAPGQVEYTKPKLSKEEMPTSQLLSAKEIR
uniref:Major sperm protein n=1 Tax=Onchocerca volvulus TaxID=6282 RepID=A0A8R1XTX2_ONCVO